MDEKKHGTADKTSEYIPKLVSRQRKAKSSDKCKTLCSRQPAHKPPRTLPSTKRLEPLLPHSLIAEIQELVNSYNYSLTLSTFASTYFKKFGKILPFINDLNELETVMRLIPELKIGINANNEKTIYKNEFLNSFNKEKGDGEKTELASGVNSDRDTHITSDGTFLMPIKKISVTQTSPENLHKIPRTICAFQDLRKNGTMDEGYRESKCKNENIDFDREAVKAEPDAHLSNGSACLMEMQNLPAAKVSSNNSLNVRKIACAGQTINEGTRKRKCSKGNIDIKEETVKVKQANLATGTLDDLLQNYKLEEKSKIFLELLRIYTKHKSELLSPELQEQDVWKRIFSEMQKKYSLNCDAVQCCNTIKQLQSNYERNKNKSAANQATKDFLNAAKNAFETNKGPDFRRLPEKKKKWRKKKKSKMRLAMLKIYNRYKKQFSSPDVNEEDVWKKMAERVSMENSLLYSAYDCVQQMLSIKRKYENIKSNGISSPMHIFFEEGREAFENSEYPDTLITSDRTALKQIQNFAVTQTSSEKNGTLNEGSRKRKYKKENIDIEEEAVKTKQGLLKKEKEEVV